MLRSGVSHFFLMSLFLLRGSFCWGVSAKADTLRWGCSHCGMNKASGWTLSRLPPFLLSFLHSWWQTRAHGIGKVHSATKPYPFLPWCQGWPKQRDTDTMTALYSRFWVRSCTFTWQWDYDWNKNVLSNTNNFLDVRQGMPMEVCQRVEANAQKILSSSTLVPLTCILSNSSSLNYFKRGNNISMEENSSSIWNK